MSKAQALAAADALYQAVCAEEFDAFIAYRASGSAADQQAWIAAQAEKLAALKAWEAAADAHVL